MGTRMLLTIPLPHPLWQCRIPRPFRGMLAWTAVAVLLGPAVTNAGQLTLTWVDNSGGLAAFNIERKISTGGTYSKIAEQEAGDASYIDRTVTPGTTYCYRVQAFNGTETSDYSNEACANAAGSARQLPDFNGDGTADILWQHSS